MPGPPSHRVSLDLTAVKQRDMPGHAKRYCTVACPAQITPIIEASRTVSRIVASLPCFLHKKGQSRVYSRCPSYGVLYEDSRVKPGPVSQLQEGTGMLSLSFASLSSPKLVEGNIWKHAFLRRKNNIPPDCCQLYRLLVINPAKESLIRRPLENAHAILSAEHHV